MHSTTNERFVLRFDEVDDLLRNSLVLESFPKVKGVDRFFIINEHQKRQVLEFGNLFVEILLLVSLKDETSETLTKSRGKLRFSPVRAKRAVNCQNTA